MAQLNNKSKRILIYFMIVVSFILSSCSSTDKESQVIRQKEKLFTRWEEIFDYDGTVSFQFSSPSQEIYTLGMLGRNSQGEYFILDGKAQKILNFAADGKFKKYIGQWGEGPGEYMFLLLFYISKANDLYLYDIQKMVLSRFTYPDYKYDKMVRLPNTFQDIIVTEDGSIIGYSTSDPAIIHKISPEGKKVEKFFTPADLQFRIFSSRFQLGGFSKIPNQGFLFSYPDKYKIYWLDYNIKVKKAWVAQDYNEFITKPLSFPKDLDPYGYSPKHAKWWGESIKPAMVIYLRNGFFLQILLKFNNLSGVFYANLHHLDGSLYALGLEVPYNGRIVYNDENGIYIVEDASIDNENRNIPLKVHKYRFKNLNIRE